MGRDDITVRITAEGRIVFDMAGRSQEEIRLQRELAEEMLGPVVEESGPGEPPPPSRVRADDEGEDERLRGRG